jgi:mannose-6-phosphate isomerase-like protein (cupin superfamily)
VADEEEYGGDPPCWAHLFHEEIPSVAIETEDRAAASASATPCTSAGKIVDLVALVRAATPPGAIWTRQSDDLDINVLLFAADQGVAEHVNPEVDVLLVGIAGAGAVTIDGERQILSAGQALVVPKGTRRSTNGVRAPFAYLSCHRRRGALWPGRQL